MFQRKVTPMTMPQSPKTIPNGSFVRTAAGHFYILNKTTRARVISDRVLNSWSPQRIVVTSEDALKNYRIASRLRFRNGSLIWNLADARVYLIEDGKRRWVKNPDWLFLLGAKDTEICAVSQVELELHPIGEDLD